MGFAFNLIFFTAQNEDLTLGLILGAPAVPALMLLVSLWFCPESPRYVRPPAFILQSFFIRLEGIYPIYFYYRHLWQRQLLTLSL